MEMEVGDDRLGYYKHPHIQSACIVCALVQETKLRMRIPSMHYVVTSTISLDMQPHPNQLRPKRENVWNQQHQKVPRMMSPGTVSLKCLSIATLRLLHHK